MRKWPKPRFHPPRTMHGAVPKSLCAAKSGILSSLHSASSHTSISTVCKTIINRRVPLAINGRLRTNSIERRLMDHTTGQRI